MRIQPLLNPTALSTPANLAKTFNQIAAQGKIGEPVIEDLRTLSERLRETNKTEGNQLSFHAQRISRDIKVPESVKRIEEILSTYPVRTLEALRHTVGGAAPSVSADLASTDGATRLFDIDGEDTSVSSDRGFGRVVDPTRQVPVIIGSNLLAAAKENMNQAMDRLLRKKYPEHSSHFPRHFAAVLSGEIGAPVELRNQVVDLLAQDVGMVCGYFRELLSTILSDEELLSQLKYDVITVIPDLENVEKEDLPTDISRKGAAETEVPLDRAMPISGDVEEIGRELYFLRNAPAHEEAIRSLEQINPNIYGRGASAFLQRVIDVIREFRTIKDPKARAEFLASCAVEDPELEKYLSEVTDPRRVEVSLPGRSPRPDKNWGDPIRGFMASSEFEQALKSIPRDSSEYPLKGKIRELVVSLEKAKKLSHGHQDSVRTIESVARQGNLVAARQGLLRLKLSILESNLRTLREAGVEGMGDLENRTKRLISEGLLREAELVIDYARQWTDRVAELVKKRDDLKIDLYLICEKEARSQFILLTDTVLKVGDLDALSQMIDAVEKQAKEGEIRLKAHLTRLVARAHSAAIIHTDSLRELGAIANPAERTSLAIKVPGIKELIKEGPSGEDQARAYLKGLGFRLGEPGVLAIGTRTARGLLPLTTTAPAALPSPTSGAAPSKP